MFVGKSVQIALGAITALGLAVSSPFIVAEATGAEIPVVENVQAAVRRGGENFDEYLAEALGITLDELEAAKSEARSNMLDDAVAEGTITEEEADLIRAREALSDVIDRKSLTAEVLGITVEELEAAREAGTTMEELLEEAGLTAEEFSDAMQAAFEAAVQQAVEDGLITAEQAEQIIAQSQNRDGGPGRGGRGGRGGGRGPGGPGGGEPADEGTQS